MFCCVSEVAIYYLTVVNPLLACVNLLSGASVPVSLDAESLGKELKMQMWLVYWVFFAIFGSTYDLVLKSVPGACIVKAIFLVWLYHPKFQGGLFLVDLVNEKHWAQFESARKCLISAIGDKAKAAVKSKAESKAEKVPEEKVPVVKDPATEIKAE